MTLRVELDTVTDFIFSVLTWQKPAGSIWGLSEQIIRNEMVEIMRPRSNLILNTITPLPTPFQPDTYSGTHR